MNAVNGHVTVQNLEESGPLFWILYSPSLIMAQRPESSLSQRAFHCGCHHIQQPRLKMAVAPS